MRRRYGERVRNPRVLFGPNSFLDQMDKMKLGFFNLSK